MGSRGKSVLHVVHSLNLGGAERLASRLAITLSDEFDVAVACIDDAGLWAKEVRDAGVPVFELDRQPGVDLAMPVRIGALARARGAGLLHAHQYTPTFYASLARSVVPSAKVLFHEHGRHFPEIESSKRVAYNKAVLRRLLSRVVAVSEECRERVVRYEGLPRESIEVVYNGVDAPEPPGAAERAAIRASLGLAPDALVAGTVGRLDPVKNVPMAMAAAARLISEGMSDLRLLVIGDGPARAEIEAAAEAHGLEDVVVMTGFRDDAAVLVAAMDLFLLPSSTEGTSLALVSAMAAAIPSVATRVGGTPEVLEEGVAGLLTPPGDVEALTKAMGELLRDPERRRTMGEAARRAYLGRFTWDAMVESFRRIYREMLGGRG